MAVTKQTYTAAATWTATQLADIFKQAFIDAGLMTDWFDSFSNTVENRVLRVVNDGSKTYGTVYYWFMFTTGGVFVATTSTWNATTHVPTGTQYIDYYAATTNVTTNHTTMLALTPTTTCTLTRYTSGVNNNVSIFLLRNGTSNFTFMLSHPGFNANSMVDQNAVQFNALYSIYGATSNNMAIINTTQIHNTRASYLGAVANRGRTSSDLYLTSNRDISSFRLLGNVNNSLSNAPGGGVPAIYLPVADNNTNTNLASDHTPVFTSPQISPYMNPLPSDFAMIPYYVSSAMTTQDTFVVTAGVEEWEMLVLAVVGVVDAAKLFFCARTV